MERQMAHINTKREANKQAGSVVKSDTVCVDCTKTKMFSALFRKAVHFQIALHYWIRQLEEFL
jgi:hypothetical protein